MLIEDRGESTYQDMLPLVVSELQSSGLAVESDGALCVFVPGFVGRDGKPLPSIIQKSDGGYNYDTTDLAALRHRLHDHEADRLIYITDRGQEQRFKMLFEIARMVGWAREDVPIAHLGFGVVQGADHKRLRTRDGGTVKLKDLLDEAENRALALLTVGDSDSKRRNFSESQKRAIAKAVGTAAVKYADLSHSIESDYVFDWDKMLSLEGDTGPYLMYAYTRISGIGRKAGVDFDATAVSWPKTIELSHPSELSLGKKLLQFPEVVEQVETQLRPNLAHQLPLRFEQDVQYVLRARVRRTGYRRISRVYPLQPP